MYSFFILSRHPNIEKVTYKNQVSKTILEDQNIISELIKDGTIKDADPNFGLETLEKSGTQIIGRKKIKDINIIRGVSFTKNDAKVSLLGVKDKPGVAAAIFEPLYKNSINVDMVVQNISSDGKETDLTFTIKSDDLLKTKKLISKNKKIRFKKLIVDKNVAKVSIVGVGMITTPGVTYRMFQALANKKINILVISTSEIKISVLISNKQTKKAIATLHKEFKIDSYYENKSFLTNIRNGFLKKI